MPNRSTEPRRRLFGPRAMSVVPEGSNPANESNGEGRRDDDRRESHQLENDNPSREKLRDSISTAAIAFRGYDVTNQGRSRELLEHRVYGPVIAETLAEASAIAADSLHRNVDLIEYVKENAPTSIAHFADDVALIVAMEQAQIRVLERCFDVPVRDAKLTFGYSIGEMSSLILSGVFPMDKLLAVPLEFAADCAELAADTHMGVLFTRGPALPFEEVERLCVQVSAQGEGLIGPSAYLSPNTALLLGQGDTLARFESIMRDALPMKANLRRNPHHWPPLHTPLVWHKSIPNRTAVKLFETTAETDHPNPPILSCVTGKFAYEGVDPRETLTRWTDHPQRLWDVIHESLAAGVQTVVHVGPEPKLIHATFSRLSNNINKLLGNKYIHMIGHGVVSSMNRHAWLSRLLSSRTALLRAPFVSHIILEDWLLAQPIDSSGTSILVPAAIESIEVGSDRSNPNPNPTRSNRTSEAEVGGC